MKQLSRQSAFSLVEILISMAVMGVVFLGVGSMLEGQRRQSKSLDQKQELNDLQNLLQIQLGKSENCAALFRNKQFDVSNSPSASNPSKSIIELSTLNIGGDGSSNLIARANEKLPGSITGLKTKSIYLNKIYPSSNPLDYHATLNIDIDPSSTSLPSKKVDISLIIQTDAGDPENSKRILSCSSAVSREADSPAMAMQIFPGWPNQIKCNNIVYSVVSPAKYQCVAGQDSPMKAAILEFDPNTKRFLNCIDPTVNCGNCGGACRQQSVDELMNNELAK